jgi:hypothetical protein
LRTLAAVTWCDLMRVQWVAHWEAVCLLQ